MKDTDHALVMMMGFIGIDYMTYLQWSHLMIVTEEYKMYRNQN